MILLTIIFLQPQQPQQPTSSSSQASVPTSNPGGCTSQKWAQCGGIGFTGCTTCVSGTTCTKLNDWYSQWYVFIRFCLWA